MKKHIIVIAASLSLIACASTTNPDASNSTNAGNTASEAQLAKNEAGTKPESTAGEIAKQTQLARQLTKESVYFDFDKYAIKPEFQNVIKAQDEFLLANKGSVVTLEGNCDERGSTEYNLGLGDRRARSVSRQLQILGLPKERINVVSNGEDKPRMACHEENCWQENRRVDFMHKLN